MSGLRAGLALPGADAATVVNAARLAGQWNLDTLWIGDPAQQANNADDTYVMVTAAAAAATTHLRLGVFLSARSSAPPVRIAEDIGVVDQISAGRLSVAFTVPDGGVPDAALLADLERITGAHRSWALADGRSMPVTPAPAQPSVPTALFTGAPGDAGTRLARPLPPASSLALLAAPWPDPAIPPEAPDLLHLKTQADDANASELILLVDPTADLAAVLPVLGTVVAPCLRAADHEVGILALDATRWLNQRGPLHHWPNEQPTG